MRSERINFLAATTATAGLVGFIGVFADWFRVTYAAAGGLVTMDIYGVEDGTGAIAVAAALGALLFGCAYILLRDADVRRLTVWLMAICSVALFVAATLGFSRVDDVLGPNPFLPGADGATTYEAGVALGLAISFLCGLIATVATVLLISRRERGTEEAAAAA
jgi:ABC-type Fe3+-siderophore transport system permease subunit